jgi:hypothetical protein
LFCARLSSSLFRLPSSFLPIPSRSCFYFHV